MAAVMGGALAATAGVEYSLAAAGVTHSSQNQLLRVGTFESAQGRTIGQIVAYRGHPSWVFMSIRDGVMNGTVGCQIHLSNGHTAPTGIFVVNNGRGEWARTVSFDVGAFRNATLTSPQGATLATATFTRA
ncbi:MAG TPA: hypothetical protein VKR22_01900 [Acidimicrobiales bacterium]|nr:hypothetical protein [Acidimicrobiales bacterium]